MSRQGTSSPPPEREEIPVTQDDYNELLRHLNTQGHIVVLNLHVPERPKKTWGQLLLRRPPVVHDNVLYKEDIPKLIDELKDATKNRTMISDISSKKLKSINTMLHETKPRGSQPPAAGSSASDVSSQPKAFDDFDDSWEKRTMDRARIINWDKAKQDREHHAAQIQYEIENPARVRDLNAEAIRTAADLANLDNEKLLAEFQVYKSKGGPFDIDGWKKTRHYGTTADPWPDMTVPGEVGKPNSSKQFANLLGYFDWGRSGGKSKRSKSRSNKGKKSHRSRSNCRRSTCRRSTCRRR